MTSEQRLGLPNEIDMFDISIDNFRKETEASFADFMKGVEESNFNNMTSHQKSNELWRLKKGSGLSEITTILEYEKSRTAAKWGFWLAVAGAGVCVIASCLSPLLSDVGYTLADTISKSALVFEGGASLVTIVNENYVSMFEKPVRKYIKGIFGEDNIKSERDFIRGMKAANNVYSGIKDRAHEYGISIVNDYDF